MISTATRKKREAESYSNKLKNVLASIPEDVYDRVLTSCQVQRIGKSLKDADEFDIQELKRLNYQAMRTGLSDADPQMARVFQLYLENEEGKEQVGDVLIHIVPHEIKDVVPAWLFKDAEGIQ